MIQVIQHNLHSINTGRIQRFNSAYDLELPIWEETLELLWQCNNGSELKNKLEHMTFDPAKPLKIMYKPRMAGSTLTVLSIRSLHFIFDGNPDMNNFDELYIRMKAAVNHAQSSNKKKNR